MMSRLITGCVVNPTIIKHHRLPMMQLLDIHAKNLIYVKRGLYAAFNMPYGKNYSACTKVPGFDISGKSGTAQTSSMDENRKSMLKDHSLFIGFGPYNNTKYLVGAIVEYGGWGSKSAMPIVIDTLLHMHYTNLA